MSAESKEPKSKDLKSKDLKSKEKPSEISNSQSLPFEPASHKKKKSTSQSQTGFLNDRSSGIPEVVSQRMGRRMAVFSGVPSFLGMATFVVSYYLVSQQHYSLPNSAVLLVSLGFFGLGVVGLSYGILSASWDPEQTGSLLGTEQFGLNFSRATDAFKEARRTAIQENERSKKAKSK
jgi:VIT1/CCC1 family predicted Fe2+/Mn2+ transporter